MCTKYMCKTGGGGELAKVLCCSTSFLWCLCDLKSLCVDLIWLHQLFALILMKVQMTYWTHHRWTSSQLWYERDWIVRLMTVLKCNQCTFAYLSTCICTGIRFIKVVTNHNYRLTHMSHHSAKDPWLCPLFPFTLVVVVDNFSGWDSIKIIYIDWSRTRVD